MKELGRIIQLNKKEEEGYSSCTDKDAGLPFVPKRLYWIYDVPGGESRGGHAHKKLKQIIIAASGSFTVHLDDGQIVTLFKAIVRDRFQIFRKTHFAQGAAVFKCALTHYRQLGNI